jgi:hypothetical protein
MSRIRCFSSEERFASGLPDLLVEDDAFDAAGAVDAAAHDAAEHQVVLPRREFVARVKQQARW